MILEIRTWSCDNLILLGKENKVEYIHSQCKRPPQSCTQCISMPPPKLSMEAQLESNKSYLGNLVVALELQCTGVVGSWYDVDR